MKDPADKTTGDLFPPMKCDKCGATLHSYDAVGYDGPASEDCLTSCHPFMPWLVLCCTCVGQESVI